MQRAKNKSSSSAANKVKEAAEKSFEALVKYCEEPRYRSTCIGIMYICIQSCTHLYNPEPVCVHGTLNERPVYTGQACLEW